MIIGSIKRVLDTPAIALVEHSSDSTRLLHSRGGLDRSIYAPKTCKSLILECAGAPPGHGLYVWEGFVFADQDVACGGWRECTDAERDAICHGKTIWKNYPNGNSDDEMVLVCDADRLRGAHDLSGVGFFGDEQRSIYEDMIDGHYDCRGEMEFNPDFKQIIPYVVLRDKGLFFCYKRKQAGNEPRLHNQFSLGVGGHVDMMTPIPSGTDRVVATAMRELHEEVDFGSLSAWSGIYDDSRLTYLGVINDDSDHVGTVHMGALFVADVRSHIDGVQVVTVRESDKMEGRWMTRKEVSSNLEKFESWSQIAFQALS